MQLPPFGPNFEEDMRMRRARIAVMGPLITVMVVAFLVLVVLTVTKS